MLTLTQLIALEQSLRGRRVLSVYCSNDVSDPIERDTWRRHLTHELADLRHRWDGAPHGEREALSAAIAHLTEAVEDLPLARPLPAWVGFATADGVLHAERLSTPVPSVVAWQDQLRLAPYVRVLQQAQGAVIAVVDSRAASLYTYRAGQLAGPTMLHAEHRSAPSSHMGDPPRPGFHAGTRGPTRTDRAEHAHQVAWQRLLVEVAERLPVLAAASEWIFVGGIPELAKTVVSHVARSARERTHVLAGLDVHATPAQIAATARRAVDAMLVDADLALVETLVGGESPPEAVRAGSPASMEALRIGAVDRLVFSTQFVHDHPRIAEDAVRAAIAGDCGVASVDGDAAARLNERASGMVAHLRYVPPVF